MRHRPRSWFMVIACWSVPAGLWGQNAANTASGAAQTRSASAAQKPVRKPDQVITNDSIGLLAVRRAPKTVGAPAGQPAAARDDGAVAPESEIASLQQQIKERQKRIALLMKLFVNDEKEFLKNAGGVEADAAAQERRKYEQDELRWETAELAKVTARVEELKSGSRR